MLSGLWLLAQKPPPPPTPDDYKRSAQQDGQHAEAVMASLPDPNDPKQSRREARNETMIFREMSRQLSGGDFLHWLKKHWDTNLKRDKYRAAMKRVKEAADAYVKSMKKGGFGSKKLLTDLEQAKRDAEKARKELQQAIFAEQEAAMGGLVECGAEAAEWCVSKNHDKCKELDCSEDECECTLYYAWFGGKWEPKEQEKIRQCQGSSKKAGGGGGGGGGQQGAKPPGVEPGPQPGPGKPSEKEPGDAPKGDSRQYAPGDKPPPPLKASPIISPSGTTSTQGGEFAAATRAPDGLALYASQPVGVPSRSVTTENPCLPYWTLAENILASASARRGVGTPQPTVSGGTMIVTVADEAMRREFQSLYQKDAARLGSPPRECVRVVAQTQPGDGSAPGKGSTEQPPATDPTGTSQTRSEVVPCATCEDALAAADNLSTEQAIWCLAYAASRISVERRQRLSDSIDLNDKDRQAVLSALRRFCKDAAQRPIGPPGVVFQESGSSEQPKPATPPKPAPAKKTLAQKPCPDENFKALIIYDGTPWVGKEKEWNWRSRSKWRDLVGTEGEDAKPGMLQLKVQALKLANGKPAYTAIAKIDWREEGGVARALAALKSASTDPCVRFIAIVGHGGSNSVEIGQDISVTPSDLLGLSDPKRKELLGALDHLLDTLVIGVCQGNVQDLVTPPATWNDAATQAWAPSADITVHELYDKLDEMLNEKNLRVPGNPKDSKSAEKPKDPKSGEK